MLGSSLNRSMNVFREDLYKARWSYASISANWRIYFKLTDKVLDGIGPTVNQQLLEDFVYYSRRNYARN